VFPRKSDSLAWLPGFETNLSGVIAVSPVGGTLQEDHTLPGPGDYLPDPTEGITRIEDLPRPRIRTRSRNRRRRPCPRCGHGAYRDRAFQRTLHHLGALPSGRPSDVILTYSQHYCTECRRYFTADCTDLAAPGSHYTQRVVALAVRRVAEDGLPYQAASWG